MSQEKSPDAKCSFFLCFLIINIDVEIYKKKS